MPKGLRNFEKSSNMPKILHKNEEKPCLTCLKHPADSGYQKIQFWVSDPSLFTTPAVYFEVWSVKHHWRQACPYNIFQLLRGGCTE